MMPRRFLRPLLVIFLLAAALSLALGSAGAGPVAPEALSGPQSAAAEPNGAALLECTDPPAEAPVLLSPENHAVITSQPITLSWNPVTDAEEYVGQLGLDPDFAQSVEQSTTETSYAVPTTLPPDYSPYYWRVKARNACGDGPWSETWMFEIPGPSPTVTHTPSNTPIASITPTASHTPTASDTPTPTNTFTPTNTPTTTFTPTNTPTITPTPSETPEGLYIYGEVRDAGTWAGLQGAVVRLYRRDGSSWTLVNEKTSDVNGRWAFGLSPVQTLHRVVETDPSGYTSDRAELPEGYPGTVVDANTLEFSLPEADSAGPFLFYDRRQPTATPTATPTPASARIRIAHLAPFAPDPGTAVDVKVDGVVVLAGFEFADSTAYLPIAAGVDHTVQVFPAGGTTPVLAVTINLTPATDYSAIALGGPNGWPIAMMLIEDDNAAPPSGAAKVQFGHLAPFAAGAANTEADLRLQDGFLLGDNLQYGYIAAHAVLSAGVYDLKITSPDGATTLIDPLPVSLPNGAILSAFAVGDGGNQPLGVFVWPSNEVGYLLPLAGEGSRILYLPLIRK